MNEQETEHPRGPIHDYLHGYFKHCAEDDIPFDAEDVDKLAAALTDEFGEDVEIAFRARELFNVPTENFARGYDIAWAKGWNDARNKVLGSAAVRAVAAEQADK